MIRVTGRLQKILMLVCGFRVEICLDNVVAKVYLNIKEMERLVAGISIFMSKFNGLVDRIQVINEGFKMVFAFTSST